VIRELVDAAPATERSCVMPQRLSYESHIHKDSHVRRIASGLLARRSVRLIVLALLYAATYASLRTSRLLIHRNYLYWDENAPGSAPSGGYVEKHDIGGRAFFDVNGRQADDAFGCFARVAFWPLVRAESYCWRQQATSSRGSSMAN